MANQTARASADRGWQPLLAGEPGARARAATDDIASALLARAREPLDPALRTAPSLADAALFLARYARTTHQSDLLDASLSLANHAIRLLGDDVPFQNLHMGVLKVAWVRAHLDRVFDGGGNAAIYSAIDEALIELLASDEEWRGNFDLLDGLAGFAVYFIERWPDPAAEAALARIVVHLDRLARPLPEGVAWFTQPHHLFPVDRALTPEGHFALGMAHGTAGVIGVLLGLRAIGIQPRLTEELLTQATAWLLAQEGRSPGSRYTRSSRGGPRQDAFYGWCWGDLGIAAMLASAGFRGRAAALALEAARHPPERPIDAGLCHGAAGNGHLVNRVWQATGHEPLREEAERWFARALDYYAPGDGIGGFKVRQLGPDGRPVWVSNASMLIGSTGIGLALLAAIDETPPAWDRLLGLFF